MNAWHFTASERPRRDLRPERPLRVGRGRASSWPTAAPRASVQAAYNDTAADYRHMVRFAAHALDWLSHDWPGVPYPYEKTTVVQGFAGMEYPMMANDESYADTVFSRFVAEHEIAHTYFPFYMGINETRYAVHGRGDDDGDGVSARRRRPGAGEGATASSSSSASPTGSSDPSPLEDVPIITPNSHGRQRLRQARARLPRAQGAARRRAATGRRSTSTWSAGTASIRMPWDYFNTFNDVTGENLELVLAKPGSSSRTTSTSRSRA